MKKEIDERIKKSESIFEDNWIKFELTLSNLEYKEAREKIQAHFFNNKNIPGVYIISNLNSPDSCIYVGQSGTSIRNRILIHLDAIYEEGGHLNYQAFFSKYKYDIEIKYLQVLSNLKVDNDLKAMIIIKETLLTSEYKPAFVFLRTKPVTLK
jgi:hypothetical protein